MKNLLILLNRVLDALQSSQQGRRSGLSLYGEAAIAKLAAGCCIPFLLPPSFPFSLLYAVYICTGCWELH